MDNITLNPGSLIGALCAAIIGGVIGGWLSQDRAGCGFGIVVGLIALAYAGNAMWQPRQPK